MILCAAGRDFRNPNVFFRDNSDYEVVVFITTEIPHVSDRVHPPSLPGRFYPEGIPILPEDRLEEIVKKEGVTDVFSYIDVSHEHVVYIVSVAMSARASSHLLGPRDTILRSKRLVIAVVATRTVFLSLKRIERKVQSLQSTS